MRASGLRPGGESGGPAGGGGEPSGCLSSSKEEGPHDVLSYFGHLGGERQSTAKVLSRKGDLDERVGEGEAGEGRRSPGERSARASGNGRRS
jgi:hypothetical protein